MTSDFIKNGMVFDFENHTWEVVEEGDYTIENGTRVAIDNRRRNKWWCKKISSTTIEPPLLMCFDATFDNDKCRDKFRWPDTSNSGTEQQPPGEAVERKEDLR